jgi:hypothetical protein
MKQINKKFIIMFVSLVMAFQISACTKSFGGHSVSVEMPSNGCSIAPCNATPNPGGIFIK